MSALGFVSGFKRLLAKAKNLAKETTGKPVDVILAELFVKKNKKSVKLAAEAMGKYRAAHPAATDGELAAAAISRWLRHKL